MSQLKFERLIDVPADVAWQVISDVEDYAETAPNLDKAVIEEGEGEGMIRRCWDTNGGTWRERCVLWDNGRAYAMQVDTSDYPYPFKAMQGTWSIEPQAHGTLIQMQFDYQLKYGPVGKLLGKTLEKRFKPIGEALLDNWEKKMLANAQKS